MLTLKLLICLQADRQMFVLHLVHGIFSDMFAKQVNVYCFVGVFLYAVWPELGV